MKLRTYIVEDNATIRENLIGTLEELASVQAVGIAETEDEGKDWLSVHGDLWDLAIVDFTPRQRVGRSGRMPDPPSRAENGGIEQLRHPGRPHAVRAVGG